ncbi:hypothetical protein FSP39_018557 [Pinctada imbricata]|uniref:non-specific serine/threonine protein kinase n=1 Tax=Pinctada imbricata TaxID=66713 RepID=A0AA89C6Y6_PINIB|nr:hypothetical protein FSP39_018557 [Pinctada imbricata]
MPRNYVDNAQNRRLGRVGMPVGSCVVSNSSSGSGAKTYVDNAYNRSVGRVGMPHGSMVVSRESSNSYSSVSGDKTYVDNAYNRSIGRVGMPHGSMEVSRDSSAGMDLRENKTYVVNPYNRSVGRVGMPHGSMVISRKSSARADLRKEERAHTGLNKDEGSMFKSNDVRPKTYADNPMNRQLGRTDLEHGAMPVSKSSPCSVTPTSVKVYKDNSLNRRIGRVGQPLGTMVVSRNDYSQSSLRREVYVDNALNRFLGRVGLPRGSVPFSKTDVKTEMVTKIRHYLKENKASNDDVDLKARFPEIEDVILVNAYEDVVNIHNRYIHVTEWKKVNRTSEEPRSSEKILSEFHGTKIDFEELELGKRIGQGGFGVVYFAEWLDSVVAVKTLRVQRVSKKRLTEFSDEVAILCRLSHPRVVKFIGACVKPPNLCIVMEFMQTSLFDAIHVDEDLDFTEDERLDIIRQTAAGIVYLHSNDIAHCDMKSQNVLLNYLTGETLDVKITDFGLSMMKVEADTASSASQDYVRRVGTPRYSAPEVLLGDLLSLEQMKKADMYSFSLVVFEVVCVEEPFYKMNYAQLQKQVGERGLLPKIPEEIHVDFSLHRVLMDCWSRDPQERPTAEEFYNYSIDNNKIYMS